MHCRKEAVRLLGKLSSWEQPPNAHHLPAGCCVGSSATLWHEDLLTQQLLGQLPTPVIQELSINRVAQPASHGITAKLLLIKCERASN